MTTTSKNPTAPETESETGRVVDAGAQPMKVGDLSKMADEYHVPMAGSVLHEIAGESGEVDPAKARAFESYLQNAAAGLFPTLAPQIQAGLKTAYLLDPYRQVGKIVLGADFEPDFIGDPRSTAALSGGQDLKTGRPVPMTLDQWKQHLMTEPSFNWIKTPAGQRSLQRVTDAMKQGFNGEAPTAGGPAPDEGQPAPDGGPPPAPEGGQ